jgi:predicted TIM-barrel fold metal-dependent hydrolase
MGANGEMLAFKPQPFNWIVDAGRVIFDSIASAICHGMLTRFPGVRLISVENGGGWVPALLKQLALAQKKMPREFTQDPVETFKRQVWVNPFWEDSLDGLIELIGADRVCFGSDYPHAEGLAEPLSWLDQLEGHDAATVQQIASSNMYELVGVAPPTSAAA